MAEGASNHSCPRPLTRIAVVTPFRAMAVTIDECSMPWVASMIALAETIERLRKNCEVAAMNSSTSRAPARSTPLPASATADRHVKERRRGGIARLCTSSPISSACDWIAFRSTAAGLRAPVLIAGASTFCEPFQPLDHVGAVRAEAQHAADAFVEVGVGGVAVGGFFTTNTGIDGEIIPDIGPTAAKSWIRRTRISPRASIRRGVLRRLGPALVEHRADHRALHRAAHLAPTGSARRRASNFFRAHSSGQISSRAQRDVDEHRLRGEHALDRQLVRRVDARARRSPDRRDRR